MSILGYSSGITNNISKRKRTMAKKKVAKKNVATQKGKVVGKVAPAKRKYERREGLSRRALQLQAALQLGLKTKLIEVKALRGACQVGGFYNSPNFAQDMTKSAELFEDVRKNGKRVGWKLTAAGKTAAKKLAAGGSLKEAKAGKIDTSVLRVRLRQSRRWKWNWSDLRIMSALHLA